MSEIENLFAIAECAAKAEIEYQNRQADLRAAVYPMQNNELMRRAARKINNILNPKPYIPRSCKCDKDRY
jgi:hypothetical protein